MKVFQLPRVSGKAEKVGRRLFRKQVLPPDPVDHPKHGVVSFDLDGLKQRFDAGAMDSVPLVLANEKNEHNDDPERVRGKVLGLERTDKGLFALFDTTDQGAQLLDQFPELGASVRVKVPDTGPHAGKQVLAHVCGTLDPVAQNMGSWEAIEASDGTPVTDLSAGQFAFTSGSRTSNQPMPTENGFSEDEVGKLRALLDRQPGKDAAAGDENEDAPAPLTEEENDLLAKLFADANDSEESDEAAEEAAEADAEAEPEAVAASDTDSKVTELTATVTDLTERLSKQKGEAEAKDFVKDGVPPVLVDLAKPLLEAGEVEAIELTGGQKLDPARIVRDMLKAAPKIDFSEVGTAADTDDDEAKNRRKVAEKAAEGWA